MGISKAKSEVIEFDGFDLVVTKKPDPDNLMLKKLEAKAEELVINGGGIFSRIVFDDGHRYEVNGKAVTTRELLRLYVFSDTASK